MYKSTTALAVVGTLGLATATRAEPITLDQSLERAARRPSLVVAASRIALLDARLALVDAWAELALATAIEVTP